MGPLKRQIKPSERQGWPQKRYEGKDGERRDCGRVRRRRKEPRLPPPMKYGEERLFGGERTERIQ